MRNKLIRENGCVGFYLNQVDRCKSDRSVAEAYQQSVVLRG
jgi:hypothetical protein